MKINVTNPLVTTRDTIRKALKSVNGSAIKWAITDPIDVLAAATAAEQALDDAKLPLRYRPGTRYEYRPAAEAANAYGNSAVSTSITLERGARDWFLVGIGRVTVWPRRDDKAIRRITISNDAAQAIVNRALEPFQFEGPITVNAG